MPTAPIFLLEFHLGNIAVNLNTISADVSRMYNATFLHCTGSLKSGEEVILAPTCW